MHEAAKIVAVTDLNNHLRNSIKVLLHRQADITMNKFKIIAQNNGKSHNQSITLTPPLLPLGNSDSMQKIKRQLIYAPQVNLPILINGEVGTEKQAIARYIHHKRMAPKGNFTCLPFNAQSMEGFQWNLDTSIERSENGTLFLSEIDTLGEQHKDYLSFVLTNQDIYRQLTTINAQLIISCNQSPNEIQPLISQIIDNCTPHLELKIPSLRKRKEDILAYVEYFVQQYKGPHSPTLSAQAQELLFSYAWPGNVSELQSVMMLLISSHKTHITAPDVLALNIIKPTSGNRDLIECLLEKDIQQYCNTHPAVYKCLDFISHNYLDEISLQDVANASFASSSHLSFLIRRHVNMTFKSILVQLRLRYAKDLIAQQPMAKITDVCLQSGFGDLSHFEKMFKRYVGSTPRQFRAEQRDACKNLLSN
ncbi:helix-turn-helix domain-containing protein [Vibrio ostreicida]|uniref:Helix-turn-helix domain-containing protein n=2 Tax=Vibrio ostreicida TaxID=526588 RepID=A0ABT8BVZ4_9VIBR|nr:AraC family transcriptional regulator [Vibrio ostreicida]MDN3610566.1 helix-turn-helix domain-containing protein [Vibrio ostreicida]